MKKYISYIALFLAVTTFGLIGCQKSSVSPSAGLSFDGSAYHYINGDSTVSPGDTIHFKWTVSSGLSAATRIIEEKDGADVDSSSVSSSVRTGTFTVAVGTGADVIGYTFEVHDSLGNVLATKSFIITVSSDMNYYTTRMLYTLDSAGSSVSFINLKDGNIYSYDSVVSKGISSSIDLGYYYDTTKKATLFAPGSSLTALNRYTMTSWTLNSTVIKKLSTTFANVKGNADIVTACSSLGSVLYVQGIATGNVFGFKTASGKYGILQIGYAPTDTANTVHSYVNINIKVQK